MNAALVLPWLRALAGRRAWLAVPVGALLAALLALDPVLGAEEGVGSYLAYVALLPAVLLLRFGAVVDARRREGLEMEEALRDARGWRAAGAALLGALLALALGLALCALPPLLQRAAPTSTSARHPVHLSSVADRQRATAHGAVPAGSALLLTFTWERAPRADEAPALEGAGGRRVALAPGVIVRLPLTPEECRDGTAEWGMNADARAAGAALVRPLARLDVPRPPPGSLPLLLARQFLFFAPLFPLTLLLARRGRAGGVLAALSALALAGLLAFDPLEDPRLPDSPLGWIGRAGLALKDALPDLRGLAAAGHGFELRSGTTTWPALGAWLGIGLLAALGARPRRRSA